MEAQGFPCGSAGKESACKKESACNVGRPGFDPWVGKSPLRRDRLPTPVFWPRKFHGLYSPWGRKELDMTEQEFCFSASHSQNSSLEEVVLFSKLCGG